MLSPITPVPIQPIRVLSGEAISYFIRLIQIQITFSHRELECLNLLDRVATREPETLLFPRSP